MARRRDLTLQAVVQRVRTKYREQVAAVRQQSTRMLKQSQRMSSV